MRRILTTTAAVALLTLAGCSSTTTSTDSSTRSTAAKAAAGKPLNATTALAAITASVPSAKLTSTVTAANDGNHLLGRPGQYTSRVTFADSRIAKSDTDGFHKGDTELGGSVEVCANEADAAARAKYIQAVTRSIPALAEYDFVRGTVVVRVSHFLTPAQAADYKAATAKLG